MKILPASKFLFFPQISGGWWKSMNCTLSFFKCWNSFKLFVLRDSCYAKTFSWNHQEGLDPASVT